MLDFFRPAPAASKAKTVPESVLKKRKSLEKAKAIRVTKAKEAKKANKTKRKDIFRRAEKYVAEYRAQERSLIRARRQARAHGNYFVEPEDKVVFVVRIRGINGVDPKSRKILQLLRLRQIHNGVFIKMSSASAKMLQIVEPYITYGAPTLKSVRALLYKRGFAKVGGASNQKQRIPITDNSIIEKALGRYNIVCLEDLVHEIFTCGPNFKAANNFLWPFKLSSPLGGFTDIATHFIEGGERGGRGKDINNLIAKMN